MVLLSRWLRWLRPPLTRSGRRRNAAAWHRRTFQPQVEPLEARLVLNDHVWAGDGFAPLFWSDNGNWYFPGGSPFGDPDPVVIFPQDTGSDGDLNAVDYRGQLLPVHSLYYHRGGFVTETLDGSSFLLSHDIYTDLPAENAIDVDITLTQADLHRFQMSDPGGILTLTGHLSGSAAAQLSKSGPGTLVLSGDNANYHGQLALAEGMVRLGSPTGLTGATTLGLAAGTTLDLNNFDATLQVGRSLQGDIRLGRGTLTVRPATTLTTVDGVVSGTGGLNVVGDVNALVIFRGPSYYSGPTQIGTGILEVDNVLASPTVTVGPGGILSGRGGQVGSVDVFGALSPGEWPFDDPHLSPGVLHSSGRVSFSGGVFHARLNGSQGHDELDADDGIGLQDTILGASVGPASTEGQTYTILHSSAGIAGTFSGLPDNATFLIGTKRFQIHYTATDVTLTHLPLFLPPIFTTVGREGGYVGTMVEGDFDGDSIPDLAVINESNVAILHGNGDGTFTRLPDLVIPDSPNNGLAVGHFHDPKILDLAITTWRGNSPGHVYVFLGNGDGTFQAPVAYEVGLAPDSIAVGDVNRDGTQDLVVADRGDNGNGMGVSVLLGNGDGTFQDAATRGLPAGYAPSQVALASLTVGGPLDLIVWGQAGPGPILCVLPGNGDGTFQDPSFSYLFDFPEQSIGGLAVGDFNNDALPDVLVVSNRIDGYGRASVFLGHGNGSLSGPLQSHVGNQAQAMAVGDLDGDGNADLVVNTAEGLRVLYGSGDGFFGPPNTYNLGGSIAFVAADFNGDGSPDLAALGFSSGKVGVLLNAVPRGGPAPHGVDRPSRRAPLGARPMTPDLLAGGDPAAAGVPFTPPPTSTGTADANHLEYVPPPASATQERSQPTRVGADAGTGSSPVPGALAPFDPWWSSGDPLALLEPGSLLRQAGTERLTATGQPVR